MDAIGSTSLWLAAVVAAWSVVTARAGRDDARLLASGARGLHAAGVLVPVALVATLLAARAEALATAGTGPLRVLVPAMLATPAGMLLVLGAFAAIAGACIPHRLAKGAAAHRARAHSVAGLLVAALLLSVVAARAWHASAAIDASISPELFHWTGVAFRVLYLLGLGVAVVPLALPHGDRFAATRLRWILVALATLIAAAGFGAWARHAGVAPAAELGASGSLLEPTWTSAHLLLALAPLLYAAAAFNHRAQRERPDAPSRVASVLLLIAAAIVVAALGPAVLDWVAQRDVAIGAPLGPLDRWGALAATLVACALAVLAGVFAAQAEDRASRLWHAAVATGLFTVAIAAVAVSARPQQLLMRPGASTTATGWGGDWTLASQGVSQEESEYFDGALVAFEVGRNGVTRVEAAGERIYRDAHGHAAGRVAVPGVVRTFGGDLRLTVRALRGDEALVRAQFYPLAWLGWSLAAATVLMLLASAAAAGRVAPGAGGK